jgi:aldose 1-epimerase
MFRVSEFWTARRSRSTVKMRRFCEMASPISSRSYGVLPSGRQVDVWTLTGRGGLVLEVITLGGIVTRMLAPGRNGRTDDVVLGFNDLDSYAAGHPYFGAITGRVAGRITNATFAIDGTTYKLAANDPPNHLHGGVCGFDKRVWRASPMERRDGAPSLQLKYLSPDGEEGYPGNVPVKVIYTVTDDNVFLVETEATTDRTTPLNLTHHSYFNLAGEGSGSIDGHWLQIFATEYVPSDEHMTLSGKLERVRDGGNSFLNARRLGEAIPALFQRHGDLYSLPAHAADELTLAAIVSEPASGRVLTVSMTESCLQFYSGVHLNGESVGKSGAVYPSHAGFCLECHGYPDASNAVLGKEIMLHSGQTKKQTTAYAFSVEAAGAEK